MMKKDPVCGMQVDEKNAPATSRYNDQQFVFCGRACKDTFDKHPERYAKAEQSGTREKTMK